MTQSKLHKAILIAILALIAPMASAATVCSGTLDRLALSPGGTVQIDYGFGVHYLCNVTESYSGVHPEACKALYSKLLTAFVSEMAVSFYFNDSGYSACTELPNWSALSPGPYHIALFK